MSNPPSPPTELPTSTPTELPTTSTPTDLPTTSTLNTDHRDTSTTEPRSSTWNRPTKHSGQHVNQKQLAESMGIELANLRQLLQLSGEVLKGSPALDYESWAVVESKIRSPLHEALSNKVKDYAGSPGWNHEQSCTLIEMLNVREYLLNDRWRRMRPKRRKDQK